ncbi:histidinol-phosphate transaminase [Vulcaniibacterium gelatinicum]|uniref:histidinol-phosphate transaminase n=1 Tax=Vulcaniibacterium gelatinicum TaxID=2598725 RepID=UPI0011C8D160|nr:histidinol-phosphate transaminase [Vulcaniibacterium gelatinicum]
MSTATALLREDLRGFAGYSSARSVALRGEIWLNANESSWANPADTAGLLRRYPAPQPEPLREALAALYGVDPARLLIGRGSDEGIDLLVRAFCAPGQGAVAIAPPVFGMYAVCARLHGARVVEVPMREGEDGWRTPLEALGEAALAEGATLVFLCSPGNPTGEALAPAAIGALARRLSGRALVVVDEAYAEYGDAPSATTLLDAHDNLVVLRTLSKAHALAAARIGCVIADPVAIGALRRCQAPYPVPEPSAAAALAAVAPATLARTRLRVEETRRERERVARGLAACPGVRRVYPSAGNFLLVRFADADTAFARLLAAGIVVRDMRALPRLDDALRITIGAPAENDRVLAVLGAPREVAA